MVRSEKCQPERQLDETTHRREREPLLWCTARVPGVGVALGAGIDVSRLLRTREETVGEFLKGVS